MEPERALGGRLKTTGNPTELGEALEEFDGRYGKELKQIAARYVGTNDAEDVYYGFLARLPGKIQKYLADSDGPLMSWLAVCIRNAALDERRRQQRLRAREVPTDDSVLAVVAVTQPADPFEGEQESEDSQELTAEVEAIMSRLPQADQEALGAMVLGGQTATAFAEKNGRTPEAARKQKERAKERFRQLASSASAIQRWLQRGVDPKGAPSKGGSANGG